MPPSLPNNQTIDFNALRAKLNQYPELYQAVNQILQSVDNAVGQSCTADAVEDLAGHVRDIGQQAIQFTVKLRIAFD